MLIYGFLEGALSTTGTESCTISHKKDFSNTLMIIVWAQSRTLPFLLLIIGQLSMKKLLFVFSNKKQKKFIYGYLIFFWNFFPDSS